MFQVTIDDPNQFNNFLIFGYIVLWLIGSVYILFLVNRYRNAKKDIDLLNRLLDENSSKSNNHVTDS